MGCASSSVQHLVAKAATAGSWDAAQAQQGPIRWWRLSTWLHQISWTLSFVAHTSGCNTTAAGWRRSSKVQRLARMLQHLYHSVQGGSVVRVLCVAVLWLVRRRDGDLHHGGRELPECTIEAGWELACCWDAVDPEVASMQCTLCTCLVTTCSTCLTHSWQQRAMQRAAHLSQHDNVGPLPLAGHRLDQRVKDELGLGSHARPNLIRLALRSLQQQGPGFDRCPSQLRPLSATPWPSQVGRQQLF